MPYLQCALIFLGVLALPSKAFAHAFGQQFTLPLPVDFYITGGVCAFVASCAVLLLFSDPMPASADFRALPRGIKLPRALYAVSKAIGLAVLASSLVLAYFGAQNFVINPLSNLFWIIFLLLFTYSTGLVLGGQWQYFDPFRTIADAIASDVADRPAPPWLSYVPIIAFLAMTALEIFSDGLGAVPIVVGIAIVLFATMGAIGSSRWGVRTWFEHADLFTVWFGLVSRVAPLQIQDGRIVPMWPGERLVREAAPEKSALFFTLFFLGATVLDGLRETAVWYQILQPVPYQWDNFFGLFLLILVPLILYAFYSLCVGGMRLVTQTPLSLSALQLRFAYSLVPIAVAYHFAHYFSLILSQGQAFIAQISDPFYKGWDLFGTAGYKMNLNLVTAETVWYIQLSAIVLGHILAATVAHYIAQRTFATKREVVVSQLPMLVLMVGLTAFGLWTLAQPFATQF